MTDDEPHLAVDLLKAWQRWDAAPSFPATAGAMENACNAFAAWCPTDTTQLRILLSSAVRTGARGMSTDSSTGERRSVEPRIARRWALAAAAGHT